jgi:hypothetical protein
MKDFIDGRTRRRFWQERRFPSAFFEEFLGFLLLVLQTAGTTQRAESLETMSFQQAEELLTWGYTELDVSKANCNIRNATFFLDEDAWEMLNLYDRSVLPFSFFPFLTIIYENYALLTGSCGKWQSTGGTADRRLTRPCCTSPRFRRPCLKPTPRTKVARWSSAPNTCLQKSTYT